MRDFLTELGIEELNSGVICGDLTTAHGEIIESRTPVDGSLIAKVQMARRMLYQGQGTCLTRTRIMRVVGSMAKMNMSEV